MTPPLFLTALSLIALFSSGCLFSKKPAVAKENSSIAGSVEESFKLRWVDKRAGELVAQGKAAEAARTQATTEFAERFVFSAGATKK
jgi:hypothetical protein